MMETFCEELSTKKGRPCLVVDQYQYRLHRKTKVGLSWVCVNERRYKCKGNIKTNLEREVLSRTDHSCVPPNSADLEIKRKMEICKRRVREELDIPVHKIFHQEMSEVYSFDLMAATPSYSSAKSALCKERRKALQAAQKPPEAVENELANNIDFLLSNSDNFLGLNSQQPDGKVILDLDRQNGSSRMVQGNMTNRLAAQTPKIGNVQSLAKDNCTPLVPGQTFQPIGNRPPLPPPLPNAPAKQTPLTRNTPAAAMANVKRKRNQTAAAAHALLERAKFRKASIVAEHKQTLKLKKEEHDLKLKLMKEKHDLEMEVLKTKLNVMNMIKARVEKNSNCNIGNLL